MNLLPNQENETPSVGATNPPGFGTGNVPAPPPPPSVSNDDSSGNFSGLKVQLMPAGEENEGSSLRRWLLILLGLLLVETALIGGGYLYLINQEADLQEKRDILIRTIETSEQQILEAEETAAKASVFGVRARMANDLLDGHLRWTKFFEHISARTKSSVMYLNFAGDFESKTVSMDAFGRSYRDVAEQIVALREDDAVIEVITTSASARPNDLGEVEGVGFSLVLTLEDYMWINTPDAENGNEMQ